MKDDLPPTVSIGLPVFNGLPYIDKALRSLREQDFEDMEIVVCDNASEDGTEDVVRAHADADPRVRYFRNEENIGGTRNFNRTFTLSRGRFFRWAGADDFVSKGVISRAVSILKSDASVVLVFPQTLLVDHTGSVVESYQERECWSGRLPARRFGCALRSWGLVNLLYGVVRSENLRHTRMLGDYPGSDFALQAELAIQGRFVQIEDEFLYRRKHERATAGLDEKALAQFYQPDRTDPFDDRYLRILRDHLSVVAKANVSGLEKGRMLVHLARKVVQIRHHLLRESVNAVKKILKP